MTLLVVCGEDRAYAESEADALFAARTLRRDRFDALRSQGASNVEVDFYLVDEGDALTHLLHLDASATI